MLLPPSSNAAGGRHPAFAFDSYVGGSLCALCNGSNPVYAFKRFVGHLGAPSGFELAVVLVLLVLTGVALIR